MIQNKKRFIVVHTILLVIIPVAFFIVTLLHPEYEWWQKILLSIIPWSCIGAVNITWRWDDPVFIRRLLFPLVIAVFPIIYLYTLFYQLLYRNKLSE
jgi:hypothetical protein